MVGIAASLLVSVLLLTPLADKENLQKLLSSIGPSFLLMLTYVPKLGYLLVFWLLVRRLPKGEWQKETMSFLDLAKIFLMTYGISTVINTIGAAISKTAPSGGTQELDMVGSLVGTGLLMGFLIPSVIGPIVEELIFRKLTIDRLRPYGERTAIVFSALCFGLFHGNLTQFLYAASVGLFFGYVYSNTGKVLLTMIMHILLNSLSSSIILLLPLLQNKPEDGNILPYAVAILIILVIAFMLVSGFVLLIRRIRKKDVRLDGSMPDAIPKSEVFKTVYLNPGVIVFFVYEIGSIVMDLLNILLPVLN